MLVHTVTTLKASHAYQSRAWGRQWTPFFERLELSRGASDAALETVTDSKERKKIQNRIAQRVYSKDVNPHIAEG